MAPFPRKRRELLFERSYPAPVDAVWRAWTEPDRLRGWWGPDWTTVMAWEIDLRVGGRIYVVTEVGADMIGYAGTRCPMDGVFTLVDERARLTYDARSWTEGEEATTTIHHTNDLSLAGNGEQTAVTLHVHIAEIGPKAKLAAFGMKCDYRARLDALAKHLAS